MFESDIFQQIDKDTFTLRIPEDQDFRILQLTDLHLGFGFLSKGKDKLALDAVSKIIEKSKPLKNQPPSPYIFESSMTSGRSTFPDSSTNSIRKLPTPVISFLPSVKMQYAPCLYSFASSSLLQVDPISQS